MKRNWTRAQQKRYQEVRKKFAARCTERLLGKKCKECGKKIPGGERDYCDDCPPF